MNVLTLWQPWASFLGIYKEFETRSWGTLERGPVAIHAALRSRDSDRQFCYDNRFFREALRQMGTTYNDLPRGKIVAVADLAETFPWDPLIVDRALSEQERAMGIFGNGRVLWRFRHVDRLVAPFSHRGAQGIRGLDDIVASVVKDAAKERLSLVKL